MTTWLEKRLARRSGTTGLETERLFLDLTESFVRTMAAKNVKRAELARRMGVDRAVVTRVMAGDRNVTLRTLVSVAASLGCRLKIEIEDDAAVTSTLAAAERRSKAFSKSLEKPITGTTSDSFVATTLGAGVTRSWDALLQTSVGKTMGIDWKQLGLSKKLLVTARPVPDPQSGDDDALEPAA